MAHNATFDRAFVVKLFPSAGEKRWLCSMSGVDWRGKGFSPRKLQELLKAHRIHTGRAYRGEHDVKSSLQLLAYCPRGRRSYFSELLDDLKQA
ncbi:MAG: hypothetical protein ACM3VX_04505 [Bacteroidota bacterium]